MNTVTEALDSLGSGIGARLAPDGDGFIKLVLDDAMDVFLEIISETELEISVRITDGTELLDDEVLEGAMRANAEARKPRFTLEAGSHALMLSDRIDVRTETPESLEQRLSDISLAAARCITKGLGHLRALVPQPTAQIDDDMGQMVTFRL